MNFMEESVATYTQLMLLPLGYLVHGKKFAHKLHGSPLCGSVSGKNKREVKQWKTGRPAEGFCGGRNGPPPSLCRLGARSGPNQDIHVNFQNNRNTAEPELRGRTHRKTCCVWNTVWYQHACKLIQYCSLHSPPIWNRAGSSADIFRKSLTWNGWYEINFNFIFAWIAQVTLSILLWSWMDVEWKGFKGINTALLHSTAPLQGWGRGSVHFHGSAVKMISDISRALRISEVTGKPDAISKGQDFYNLLIYLSKTWSRHRSFL